MSVSDEKIMDDSSKNFVALFTGFILPLMENHGFGNESNKQENHNKPKGRGVMKRNRLLPMLFLAVTVCTMDLWAGTDIYYSVGTTTTALYSGTASASGGVLVLGSDAANTIGVGDEVRVGSNRYYITSRNIAATFGIQNSSANEGTPGSTDVQITRS